MPQPNRSNHEEIPIILPAINTTQTATGTGTKGRIAARWITFGLGCILVSLALFVMFELPDRVNRADAGRSQPQVSHDRREALDQAARGASAAPASTDFALRQARRSAEQAVGSLLRKRTALEAQGVTIWGGEDYSSALEKVDAANLRFAKEDFLAAQALYAEALTLLERLQASKPVRLSAALAAGEEALSQENGPRARSEFARALAIDSTDIRAQQGAKRASNLEETLKLLSAAREHEANNALKLARAAYEQALVLDPQAHAARASLERIESTLANERFRASMSEALSAIQREDFTTARNALAVARAIDPESPAVGDAEVRLKESGERHQIAQHKARAERFAEAEQWADAAGEYASILAIDPDIQFAIAGEKTSRESARLYDRLDRYLNEPTRLYSPRPLRAAEQLLSYAADAPNPGRQLRSKIESLASLIASAKVPVPIVLVSDGLTEVMLYQVGDLGRFSERELPLRPGRYVAAGKRLGYRDVRREFSVTPGQSLARIIVRCEEKI